MEKVKSGLLLERLNGNTVTWKLSTQLHYIYLCFSNKTQVQTPTPGAEF